MLNPAIWIVNDIPGEKIEAVSKNAGISPLLAKVFINRGIENAEYIKNFLNPSMDGMYDPYLLKDMDRAVDRLVQALRNREKIFIYGDYDVDGVTSTSILYDFLKGLGADTGFYIPDRMEEGYGLSVGGIDRIKEQGAGLIVTVDCGVTAFDEVSYAIDRGIDVIVTDHHACKEGLPGALAVVNPHRPDCSYPFKELAGVGVTYKLINAVCMKLDMEDFCSRYLELVALGTIADVVALTDENRIIVKAGLIKMQNTGNLGLKTLIEAAGQGDKTINSWSVAFTLAPRINAAGRIGDARRAVKLFTTEQEDEAREIVKQLNENNRFRQETEYDILQQVTGIIESDASIRERRVLVVSGKGWHHGIIGIVASKVTERYYKPCILLCEENDMAKGSGRSIEGFDLFKALTRCDSVLERFGGHEMAAGLTIKTENIAALRELINQYADKVLEPYDLIPKIRIDAAIDHSDVCIDKIRELEMLEPFGAGNHHPLFLYSGLKVEDARTVGDDRHLKLVLGDRESVLDAIGFNMGEMIRLMDKGSQLDVACSLEVNTWRAQQKPQLNIKDMKLCGSYIDEAQYYISLDRCLGLPEAEECNNQPDLKDMGSLHYFDEYKLYELLKGTDKLVIMVNLLESARKIEKILRNYAVDIKNTCKVCYTNFINDHECNLLLIINPDPDKVDTSGFSQVVVYGEWLDPNKLRQLVRRAGAGKTVLIADRQGAGIENIIPQRADLEAVYRYIKAAGKDGIVIDNISDHARRITAMYGVNMNFFKLKKCIGIFEELGLMSAEPYGEHGLNTALMANVNVKANLEHSALYRYLQQLGNNRRGS